MKITTKVSKEQLKQFINDNAKAVKSKDKNLYDRMMYTGKVAKEDDSKVARKELVDIAKETLKVLGEDTVITSLEVKEETPVEPVVENSVKKLSKGVSKKQKSMEEVPKEIHVEEPAEQKVDEPKVDTKKSAKKSLGKKKEQPKKDDATALKTETVQEMFPNTIEIEDSKYELAHDIQSMEDLYKALSNDEEIVFAFYWTKKMLKQTQYFMGMLGQPNNFKDDLDLATTIYVSEEMKIAYHVSRYTEGCYNTLPEDFEEVEGVRYAGSCEFQIYRAV